MHTITIGRTMTGKSRLQKVIAAQLYALDLPVLVADPRRAPDWKCHRLFTTVDELVEVATKLKSAHLFVDESGQGVQRFNAGHEWLATTSRHEGHSVHFICQRHTQLSPTMRTQAERLFLFRVGDDDARMLANDWAAEELRHASKLKPGYFFDSMTGTTYLRHLDFASGKIRKISLDKMK